MCEQRKQKDPLNSNNPQTNPPAFTGTAAELLKIMEIAVAHSGGRLRLAVNEESDNEQPDLDTGHFLKLDGRHIGRSLEVYRFMGNLSIGWKQTLALFYVDIISRISALPASHGAASEALRVLGFENITQKDHEKWNALFQTPERS